MPSYDSRPDTFDHIGKVRLYMSRAIGMLLDRANIHDSSKLVEPELATFDEFTPKLAESEYGSNEYKANTAAMGEALEHHYAHNSHHPEHYENGIAGMSLIDLIEMLCDWYAASQRTKRPAMPAASGRADAPQYDDDFLRSIALNQERFGYTDELRLILTNTARELGLMEPSSARRKSKGSRRGSGSS
jgi:hypothetical protein